VNPRASGEPAEPPGSARVLINLSWFLKLRWAAALGQFVTILSVAWILGLDIPVPGLLTLVGVLVLSNLALQWWFVRALGNGEWRFWNGPRGEALIGGFLGLDLCMLAGLLYWSGGLANPFAVFFLVNLVLGSMLLPRHWAWGQAGLGLFLCLLLYVADPPSAVGFLGLSADTLLTGRLIALVAAALVLILFQTRISRQLEVNQEALRTEHDRRARNERVQALATLAAGAAHELASPLSTIAVVAKELERTLAEAAGGEETVEDVRLIRSEVARCREILDKMSTDSGQSSGESLRDFTLTELFESVFQGPVEEERVELFLPPEVAERTIRAPRDSLAQALRALIKNGFDASPPGSRVRIEAQRAGEDLVLKIIDRGSGMTEETLRKAFDPFFTTKPVGEGMGLGLFLVRAVIEEAGGALELLSVPGKGTTALVSLPSSFRGGP